MKTKRIMAFTLVMVVLLAALPAGPSALADRTPSNWAVSEMNDANTSGLLTPSAARDFQNALTRDEFCELVVEMVEQTLGYSLPIPSYNPFTDDVEPISIHALKAYGYGIINGITGTLFAPAQKVERQQLCAMMIRAIRGLESDLRSSFLSPGIATLPYKDAARIQDYAIEPVKLAYTNVIMQGDDQGNFLPRDNISSQECVAVIIRSFNRIEASRTPGMTASQQLDAAMNRVHIGYAYGDTEYGVSQNLTLPTASTGGSTVTWTSSNNNVIGISGSTGIVNTGSAPRTVTLTATIRLGNATRTKTFALTTSQNAGDRLLLDNAVNELDILYINQGDGDGTVTGRIGLPTTVLGLPVTWQSSNPSVVSTAGVVAVPTGNEIRAVTLTATIRLGSQSRTKTFNLNVVNPAYSRGVTLHGVQLGMSQTQVTQLLGNARRSLQAGNNETWQLFYSSNYNNFIAVAFINDRVVAVYSMAPGAANQLRNRSGSVISVSEANAFGGITALSYVDPGNSSQQYAIMIYDSASVIGTTRTLLAEGQEQLLFELVNAYRQRNGRTTIEWSEKLGGAARTYSANGGSGNLQQRVVSEGFDSARYAGGNIIAGNGDAFDALNQIVSNSTGSSSMRTAILQNSITLLGAGFSGGNSGTYRTYFTYALGAVTVISNVTARQNDTNVSTVNVSAGNSNAMTITLIMSPTGYNESFTVASSNTGIMTVSGFAVTSGGGTVVVTGVANGSANIVVTGNCSGKKFNIPVSVGTVYASYLTLSYSGAGTATTLSSSTNIAANTAKNETGSKTLIMAAGESIRIAAATTSGATVEWSRPNGSSGGTAAATVSRNSANNEGIISATAAGTIILTARVRTGASNSAFITHTINIIVVTVSPITVNPTTAVVNLGSDITAAVTAGNLPSSGAGFTPVYAWSSSGNQLSRTPPATETLTAAFKGSNQGQSTITFTATWSGTGSNIYLGKITRTVSVKVEGTLYAENITVSQTAITMIPGETRGVTASTVPATITQSPISYAWSSFLSDIASVSRGGANGATGTITALKQGRTMVTVELTQGAGPKLLANIDVTVNDYPAISIINSNNVAQPFTIGEFVEFSCTTTSGTLHDLQSKTTGYSVEWIYSGDNAFIQYSGDSITLVPNDVGSGTITVQLLYKNDIVKHAEYHIEIIDPEE